MRKTILFICTLALFQSYSQNVGIGTNTPLSKLHVAGTIRSDTLIGAGVRNLFASPNGRIYDSLVMPSTLNWEITGNSNITALNFFGTTNANDVIFKTNNVERGRFLAGNGFFGLGTSAPGTRLEVSAIGGDGITIKAPAGTDVGDLIFLDGTGIEKGRVYTNPALASGLILSGGSVPGVHVFINNAGDVGIGNSAPNNRLEITSIGANTSGLRFTNLTSTSPTVASVGKALSVDINGDVVLIPSAANAWQLLGNTGTTAVTNFLGTTDVQDLVFKTNNIERARILAAGNFGIGTPSPLERLHVNGNILANDGVYPQSSFNIGYSTASVMSDIFEPWTDNGIKFYDGNSLSHLHVEALGYCVLQAYSTGGSPKGSLENTSYSALALQDKGGNVGVGTTAPAASAIVDITSTSAGFAMPRMTTAQRIAIVTPIAGLQVYDTNLKGFYYYDGTKWDCANNPAGTVQYFANVTVPNGYLECNGQGVSTTTYPELFAAIGYLYGGGGATFNVPDLRGEFVRGLDMGKGVNAGRVIGTNEAASTHRELGGTGGVGTINDWWSDSKLNVVTDGLTTSSPPSNGGQLVNPYINNPATVLVYEFAHRPRNVAMLPCIKF